MKGRWWRRRRRRRRKRRRRRGKTEEGAVCRAGLLWITWSSAGLRIYSSTAAVRGSGASCMLLPRTTAKQGRGGSVCWILDSAALEPNTLQFPSARTLAWLQLSEWKSASLHEAATHGTSATLSEAPRGPSQSNKRSAGLSDKLSRASADLAPSLQ